MPRRNDPDDFFEDLAAYRAGELPEDRERALLEAAGRDPELSRALADEEALDRLLELDGVPSLSQGFERRFWKRYHHNRLFGDENPAEGRRAPLWLKLAGPVAAGVLIALGLILFGGKDDAPDAPEPAPREQTAKGGDHGGGEVIDYGDPEEEYLSTMNPAAGSETPEDDMLDLLKLLDDPRLEALDSLADAHDASLIEQWKLLRELDKAEGEEP